MKLNPINKVVLLFSSFLLLFLQACSYGANRSNITPIRVRDIESDRLLNRELSRKITKLERLGFIEGNDRNHNNIRKQLMFVFYHAFQFKRIGNLTRDQKIRRFEALPEFRNLVWSIYPNEQDENTNLIQFKLKDILTQKDLHRLSNEDKIEEGNAPSLQCNSDLCFVQRTDKRTAWPAESIEIDHLLRDNDITIELPRTVHREKTKFLDGFLDAPNIQIRRNSFQYWKQRYSDYMENYFPPHRR